MKSGGYLALLGYFAKGLVITEILVLAATGLICKWNGHWSLIGYSNGLSWAGGLAILFGIFSFFGGAGATSTGVGMKYNFGGLIMGNSPGQNKPVIQNLEDSQLMGIIFGLAGITTFVIRAIINNFII
ncbi:MAG: hypothetical protein IPO22_09515 [Anaerolineales bacterium]|nr:hypothetical protein [Anaerolineales bacterium]